MNVPDYIQRDEHDEWLDELAFRSIRTLDEFLDELDRGGFSDPRIQHTRADEMATGLRFRAERAARIAARGAKRAEQMRAAERAEEGDE